MKKKILLAGITMVAVVGGVAALSAYEAHVINVTAHIENALKVMPPDKLVFGTVFPQEYLQKILSITTSESFCETDQTRVLNINYQIVQKPKCWNNDPANPQYAPVDRTTHECPIINQVQYVEMPSLCEYLSKTPKDIDSSPYTDYGVPAFHDPGLESSIATGTINKEHDLLDEWIIDLVVPCFEGMCSQDWAEFVYQYNQTADPNDYILPAELESKDFGCDLWVEVTDIY